MQVQDVMTPHPLTCTTETTLAEAGRMLWEGDCGALPVVQHGAALSVVTDRDMFIALATRDVRASELTVGSVARRQAVTCAATEDIHHALAAMKAHRVRRLPVVDHEGRIVGIVSMNDLLLAAAPGAPLSEEQVVQTLQVICEHPLPAAVARIGVA